MWKLAFQGEYNIYLYGGTTTKGVDVHQVISLDFE
jgi:hypothetical protein